MSVDPENLDEVIARINRKYLGGIRNGADFESAERISTGSLELDIAMGGGIPIGRWSRLYGGYSSCKTLTTLSVIAEAQRMGLTCAYYNVEQQFDPDFSRDKLGVDVDKLVVVQGETIEEITEKMEALFTVAHVHVVDSCTMAVSEDELNADIRDWRPGINARAWGKGFRRLNQRFDASENTVIMVDQTRTNFKTGGEDPAGGRILGFQSSMSVSFKKGGWLWKNAEGYLDEKATQRKGLSGQTEPDGMEIRVRVEKSRVCPPFRTATMRLDLNSDTFGFDREFELMKAAKYYGIIETTSPGRYLHNGEKLHGDKQLREVIRGDEKLQKEIKKTALEAAKR